MHNLVWRDQYGGLHQYELIDIRWMWCCACGVSLDVSGNPMPDLYSPGWVCDGCQRYQDMHDPEVYVTAANELIASLRAEIETHRQEFERLHIHARHIRETIEMHKERFATLDPVRRIGVIEDINDCRERVKQMKRLMKRERVQAKPIRREVRRVKDVRDFVAGGGFCCCAVSN